jgi:tyrosyl-tRNA synthetase
VGGAEFIRKTDGDIVNVLATPLITKSDGTKMGKSEGGAVWLDPELLSPYAFYQFWLNTADADVIHYLKVFTFRTREEIEQLEKEVQGQPHLRAAQRTLAADLTTLVHGQAALDAAIFAAEALFGRGDLRELDANTLRGIAAEIPNAEVPVGTPIVDAAIAVKLVKSKGEARRAISEGGLYLNNVKVTDFEQQLQPEDYLQGKYALIRRGKKTLGAAALADPA